MLPSTLRITQSPCRSPSDEGTLLDLSAREADDPLAVPLVVHVRAFVNVPVRVTDNEMAVRLIPDEGAFRYSPVGETENPAPVPLAVYIGAFRDASIGVAENPVASMLAALQPPVNVSDCHPRPT